MKVVNQHDLPTAKVDEFVETQGQLKDLTEKNYAKLKRNIEKRGFIFPVFVWISDDGVKHLIDGHQRKRVLKQEGWDEAVPYISIPAGSQQEAAEILLEFSSQFGTITQEGLDNYLASYEIGDVILEDINFDELKFGKDKNFENKEVDAENLLDENTEQCPKCKFEFECKVKNV